MAVAATIAGPHLPGLELLSPEDPEFDSTVRSLFRGNADELLKLKPFLTILSNTRARTLVAYALKWDIAQRSGRQISTTQYKYPDAVTPSAPRRGNEIRPGEQKIAAMSIELDCGRWGGTATEDFYLSQFIDWFEEYRNADALEISVDAAIFDDGEFAGLNQSKLDEDFRAYVDAKQTWYRNIVEALDAGKSLEHALEPVEAVVKANAAHPALDDRSVRETWRRISAPEVRIWRLKYGDDAAVDLYRRALRSEPFVVRSGALPDAGHDEQTLLHVACPRCQAAPKASGRWRCACGHQWNTFDTRGVCPACGHQWKETACLICGEMSPHSDWYLTP